MCSSDLRGPLFFSAWPAALYLTPVTARPPAGRAGKRGFADGKGRPCTQPFLVEIKKGAPACRPNGIFLLPRWATRSPPHQSPSVTASPQGEASGLCYPTRKKRPKSGYADGHRNSPPTGTLRPTTPKPASGNERAIKKGVQGARPPALFLPISREKWGPRRAGGPPGRCAPRHRKSPDHPKGTPYPTAPPPWRRCTPGWVPRSRCPGPG